MARIEMFEPPTVAKLRKEIMQALTRAYPTQSMMTEERSAWMIDINYIGGIVTIQNLWLSGKMGYIVKLTDHTHEELIRRS